MAYLSLYRRWRPQTFAQVVGQQHVVRTLQNALRSRHVAHAYLFAGPRGTGKTSIARLLAKGLNCAKGVTPEPCLECESCRRIADGTSLDCLEIDGASNRGIDEVRELRERSKFAPQEGPYKIYIIDEVHMLTTEAFNALLKTLEEPPEHVVFVLATTEAHKVPATILSRCQRFDFHRFGEELVAEHLARVCQAEGIQATPAALRLLARHAEGGMRDALSLLEQCVAYVDADTGAAGSVGVERAIDEEAVAAVLGLVPEETIERFYQALKAGDAAAALGVVEEVFASGADIRQFVHAFAVHLRELLLATAGAGAEAGDLLRWIDLLADAEVQLRAGASPRFVLDLAVLRLALGKPGEGPANRIAGLEARIARLEEMLLGHRPERPVVTSFWQAAQLVQQQGQGPGQALALDVARGRPSEAQVQAEAPTQSRGRVQVQPQPQGPQMPQARPEQQARPGQPGQPEQPEQSQVGAQTPAGALAQVQAEPEPEAEVARPIAQATAQAAAQPPAQAVAQPMAGTRAVAQPPTPAEAQPVADAAGLPLVQQGHGAAGEDKAAVGCIPGDELASTWDSIMGQVRQRSIQVHALVREAKPAVLLDNALHLVLPVGCAFHKSGLEQPKVLEMLERVVSRALRRATHLRFYLGELPADLQTRLRLAQSQPQPTVQPPAELDGGPSAGTATGDRPEVQPVLQTDKWEAADALLNHPLVKKTLELFGGQVVQVIPAERQPR